MIGAKCEIVGTRITMRSRTADTGRAGRAHSVAGGWDGGADAHLAVESAAR